ncbi:MAG: hypothetical protein ACR2RB_20420 [Gammaproteobacteria bacterium]
MKFIYHRISALPKLAWLASVKDSSTDVHVWHGPRVEVREQFFVEGTWDGQFQYGEFATTDAFFGSGAKLDSDTIVFVSSSTTMVGLFAATQIQKRWVSNSLPLLLAAISEQLTSKCADYRRIADAAVHGLSNCNQKIPTNCDSVQSIYYRNIRFENGCINEFDKQMPPPFQCFKDYSLYLQSKYGAIAANARDRARRYPFQILSTQSRGFDSTAVNSIAAQHGVDKVFTIRDARFKTRYDTEENSELTSLDDGTPICAQLDLPSVTIDRRAFTKISFCEEIYYAAYPKLQDVNLHEIQEHITDVAILLTGQMGEVWRKKIDPRFLNDNLRRMDAAGQGLAELRLESGFVEVALPFIGARRWPEIHAISNAREMEAFRKTGQIYDKPIARRIATEGGVPEALFGQRKLATAVLFPVPTLPVDDILRSDYLAFLKQEGILTAWKIRCLPLVQSINGVLERMNRRNYRLLFYAARILEKTFRRTSLRSGMWRELDSHLYCFCVNRRIAAYRRVLPSIPEQVE